MSKIAKGKKGEEEAVKFLRTAGYKIAELNYRCTHGEIDIIAVDKETLVFVEVKARTSTRYGTAAEAVNTKKQRHIINAAYDYLESRGLGDPYVRFDVIAIMLGDRKHKIEHFEDAFGDD